MGEASSGRGWAVPRLCGFVFCLTVRAVRSQLLPFCIWSLPQSLGQPYYMLIPHAELLRPQSPRLCPTVPVSALLSCFLSCSPQFTHLQMFQCVGLSDVFVCCIRNPLLHYSCSTCCDFKGRHQGAPLTLPCFLCHS